MEHALRTNAPIIQIATWNDWGEGTNVERSREFGYRDLMVVQELRRKQVDRRFTATAADLRLPAELLKLRRSKTDPTDAARLDAIAELITAGELARASAELRSQAGP